MKQITVIMEWSRPYWIMSREKDEAMLQEFKNKEKMPKKFFNCVNIPRFFQGINKKKRNIYRITIERI